MLPHGLSIRTYPDAHEELLVRFPDHAASSRIPVTTSWGFIDSEIDGGGGFMRRGEG